MGCRRSVERMTARRCPCTHKRPGAGTISPRPPVARVLDVPPAARLAPLTPHARVRGLAQGTWDYLRCGVPGPGRWVTIYATRVPSEHVFIVIAGLRLDTARNGIDVGPNRNQDGPRWRILDHIPTWAHWSVRHPQGL